MEKRKLNRRNEGWRKNNGENDAKEECGRRGLKQTPWPEPASERHFSAKLVPTFCGERVPRSQRGVSPAVVISTS
jgi:hypothetical protein